MTIVFSEMVAGEIIFQTIHFFCIIRDSDHSGFNIFISRGQWYVPVWLLHDTIIIVKAGQFASFIEEGEFKKANIR